MPIAPGGDDDVPGAPRPERSSLPDGFLFGVATSGFQVEGGFNGPGQPANNWIAWERTGRVEPSGPGAGFWSHPEEALDRAAGMGCDSFRLGLEWARVEPFEGEIDDGALDGYARILEGCHERGLTPLVTLHHFTHPAWLGEEFWLRPDSPDRFRAWAELALGRLAPLCRHWVTINEPNVLALGSWMIGQFPPGRLLAAGDATVALDNLLSAHVLGYDVVHRARPDAIVTTNNGAVSAYELDAMLTDLLCARSAGTRRDELDAWIGERRARYDAVRPPRGRKERALRRLSAAASPYGPGVAAPPGRRRPRSPRRVVDAVYASPHPCTLDVVGLDYYDPVVSRRLGLPGRRTAAGRTWAPTQALWDDVPEPAGLGAWLASQAALTPDRGLWVVENGLCNRVRRSRSYPRLDAWDRPRYLREHLAAVLSAADAGAPVLGYWHWSLVDNYEWGSYEPRFGLFGIDRDHGGSGPRWLDTDSMGDDAASTYGQIIRGLRDGDRSVLLAPS